MSPRYDLLKDAYAIIGGIPDNVIDLDEIVSSLGESLECGTICCAAGWLAQHPKFQALGLGLSFCECTGGEVTYLGHHYSGRYSEAMADFFAIPQADALSLFGPRSDDDPAGISDKQVWLQRVRQYLADHGQLGGA